MPKASFRDFPFGLLMPGRDYQSGSETKEKFTGKEWDEERSAYHLGARPLMAPFVRFPSPDRYAELSPSSSPYQYALNNPVLFIDVNGDTVRQIGPFEFEETEPIVVEAEFYSPSPPNPLGWFSWWLSGESNYYAVLFNEYTAKRVLPELVGSIALAGFGAAGKTGKGVRFGLKFLRRNELLKKATNRKLINLIKQLYRKTAKIGSGSTADAIRYEMQTGRLLSPKGHFIKGQEIRTALIRLYRSGNLNETDKMIVKKLLIDIQNVLSGLQ